MAAEDYRFLPNTKLRQKIRVRAKAKIKPKNEQAKRDIELVWGTLPFKLVWYISDTFFLSLPTPAYLPFKMFSFQGLLFICFISFA